MTSSKFSRRPRVQPTPKVCHPPPPHKPPEPPPTWPPPTLTADVFWTAPWSPPPNWFIDEPAALTWSTDLNQYAGSTLGAPDHVDVVFQLNPDDGLYLIFLSAMRGEDPLAAASTDPAWLIPHQPIDIIVTNWNGGLPGQTLRVHFHP